MKIQDLDTPAVCAGAVTASTIAIQPPANLQNYSPGTNGHHDPEKDHRFAWLAENVRRKDISPLARCLLAWLITAAQWRKDRLIIVGKGQIAERMGIGKRTADRCILELIAKGCLRLASKGGSFRGQKMGSNMFANTYALGTAFEGTPPPLRPKRRENPRLVPPLTLVPPARLVPSRTADQCQGLHPLPIVPPIHTHTKESDSALNEETWKAECLKLNPERDPADITRTLDLAISQGAKDGFWKHLCRKFHSHYKAPPKPSAAKVAQKAFTQPTRPPVKSSCDSPRIGGLPFDGLSKEEWYARDNGWYGFGRRENWIKAGRPHLVLHPEKNRIVSELIAKHALQTP